MIQNSLLRRINRSATQIDQEKLPRARIKDVALKLKKILTTARKNPVVVLQVRKSKLPDSCWNISGIPTELGKTLRK